MCIEFNNLNPPLSSSLVYCVKLCSASNEPGSQSLLIISRDIVQTEMDRPIYIGVHANSDIYINLGLNPLFTLF